MFPLAGAFELYCMEIQFHFHFGRARIPILWLAWLAKRKGWVLHHRRMKAKERQHIAEEAWQTAKAKSSASKMIEISRPHRKKEIVQCIVPRISRSFNFAGTTCRVSVERSLNFWFCVVALHMASDFMKFQWSSVLMHYGPCRPCPSLWLCLGLLERRHTMCGV